MYYRLLLITRKKINIIVVLLCLFASSGFTNQQNQIQSYINKNFIDLAVSVEQIEQLSWAFDHKLPTSDLQPLKKSTIDYVEIDRALTRLYCAKLLRKGDYSAYTYFVQAQVVAKASDILTFVTFNKLAACVQRLSSNQYILLENATILSAVSMSDKSLALVENMITELPTHDKIEFMAETIRKNMGMYPLIQQGLLDDKNTHRLLSILFAPQTNFRHMLYTEGGIGMFKYLRYMIIHGYVDKESLDLWYAYWIVNISGFRGHVDAHGSLYLTENVARCVDKLSLLVYQMLDIANTNPLVTYLEYRSKQLGFSNLPTNQRLFLTHIACLLRLYNKEDADSLYTIMLKLGDKTKAIQQYFIMGLHDQNQTIHTHIPAFFANSLYMMNNDLDYMLNIMLPVYNQVIQQIAMHSYHRLAFDKIATCDSIGTIISTPLEQLNFTVDANGSVLIQKS